jgi:hypothetical protein
MFKGEENHMTATFWEANGVMFAGSFTLVNKRTQCFYTFSVVLLCILPFTYSRCSGNVLAAG